MLKVNKGTQSGSGTHNGTSYGLVLPWQSMDKMIKQRTLGPFQQRNQPRTITLQSTMLGLVIVLLRDPFFWVLSQQKKLAIRDDSKHHRIETCENMHQRGTKLCPISSDYRYALNPLALELRLYEFEMKTELMRSIGALSAMKFAQNK